MLILTGEPKSTQHCYKYSCAGNYPKFYMTKECKDIKEAYRWEVKSQWKKKPLECDIDVSVRLYFGTKRKSDWDNFQKIWQDSLQGIVFKDDSQIQSALVTKMYDKNNPRIEIDIFSN